MSVLSPTSSDPDVAPRLVWQVCESVMSPLFTGWLTWCPNFDRNWRWHLFSSRQFTLHLRVSRREIKSFSRWLIIHRYQQHRNSGLTLQNEKTTTTCEFNSRTVRSAQTLLRIGHFTSTTVQPTALTPEVYGSQLLSAVRFQLKTNQEVESDLIRAANSSQQ